MAGNASKISILLTCDSTHFSVVILWTIVYENKTVVAPDTPSYCVRSLFLQHADQNFIYNFAWNERFCLPLEKVKIGWF